jgi:hypothetical protein
MFCFLFFSLHFQKWKKTCDTCPNLNKYVFKWNCTFWVIIKAMPYNSIISMTSLSVSVMHCFDGLDSDSSILYSVLPFSPTSWPLRFWTSVFVSSTW